MKLITRISLYLSILSVAGGVLSCTYDHVETPPEIWPDDNLAELTFLADMPSAVQVATRGQLGTVTENTIADIHVLAFCKNTDSLVYKAKGKGLDVVSGSDNNNRVTFKATLPVGKEYTFMVLANAGSRLNGINVRETPRKYLSDVLALSVEEEDNWDVTADPIPMWGEKDLTLTASSTPGFELTRMLARINVDIDLDGSTGTDNFKLTSVRYYNYNTAGALAPHFDKYDPDTGRITAPTIPVSPGTMMGEALVYDGDYISGGKSCRNGIYIFEAEHNGKTYTAPGDNSQWIDNPCLVIGGQYKTEAGEWLKETFYRVDFIRKDNTDPQKPKDVWLSILRNFSYNVTVTGVSGAGYPDPDTALNSAPINMEANVLDWNERDMGEIVFDGTFYLSVSRDEFTLQRSAVNQEVEDYVLYVKTDYIYKNDPEDEKSGWKVEKYVDASDGTTAVGWLKLNPAKGAPNDRVKAYFTFEANPLSVNRSAIVWIVAGRLRYPVFVTQKVLSVEILDPDDNDAPVSRMDFVVPRGEDKTHGQRRFRVEWTPADRDVGIGAESPEVWNPFTSDWLNPNPSPAWKITAATAVPPGTQTYIVTPPAIDQAAIDLDPFYQKETTYNFTVSNGTDSEMKGITLQQIYYNILVDTYNYQLDGKTYTISVRSNADWVITGIEEWLYNKQPDPANPYPSPIMLNLNNYDNLRLTTTGGPNISGESLAFTVVNEDTDAHRGKWGTVYVTFENPDDKFEPFRAAIYFPPKKMTMLGLGYANDDAGSNMCAPTARHRNAIAYLYGAERNFGLLEESKVKVRDFRLIGFHAESGPTTPQGQWNYARLKGWINDYQPDIIALSYSILLDDNSSKLLVEYMKNGGTVIAFTGGQNDNYGYAVARLFNAVFGLNLVAGTYGWEMVTNYAGDVYPFPTANGWSEHPLINGPFGNLAGKHWGSQSYTTGFVPRPEMADKITPLNTFSDCVYGGPNGTRVAAFVHNEYRFFWCGNDSFMHSYYPELLPPTGGYPCQLDKEWNPIPRTGFGRTTPYYSVYNSAFMGNLVAWAISNADYKHPVGGYL